MKALLNRSLVKAVKEGSILNIRECLERGADADTTNKYDTPILHLIIKSEKFNFNQKIYLIDLLIDKGADINAIDNYGNTALHYAVGLGELHCQGILEIIDKLLISGIRIALENDEGETSREIAKEHGWHNIAKYIEKQEALFDAIEEGDIDKIESCLKECKNVNTTNNKGTPILHLIVNASIDTDMINLAIDWLIDRGVDIDSRDENDNTALHIAAGLNFGLEIVEKLVERGADVELGDFFGDTALEIAEENQNDDVVKFLARVGEYEEKQEEKQEVKQEIKDVPPVRIIAGPLPPPNTFYEALNDLSALKKRGKSYMGEVGMLDEIKGVEPGKDDIRQDSKKGVGGLHEIIPTDLRGEISKIPDDAKENPINKLRSHAAQVQSGARTSTRLTFFNKENGGREGKIAAHSYAFKGNAHTAGQPKAHDALRETARAAWAKKLTGERLVVATVRKQFELMPYPDDILTDIGLTGKVSEIPGIGEIKAPDPNDTVHKTSSRFQLADKLHMGREKAKQRLRTLKRSILGLEGALTSEGRATSPARVASPSPPRTSQFFTNPVLPESLPGFPGTYPVADQAAWVTQPLRLKPEPKTRKGRGGGSQNRNS